VYTGLKHSTTTRFSPEDIGCQKQMAPEFCQHPIRWPYTSQSFTRWRHLSTHPINRPAGRRILIVWLTLTA